MGTLAVGGGAYALMPSENCEPNRPGMAAPSGLQTNSECRPRGSFIRQSAALGRLVVAQQLLQRRFLVEPSSSGTSSDSSSGHVTRGGFGSFAHAFTSHFSGGG